MPEKIYYEKVSKYFKEDMHLGFKVYVYIPSITNKQQPKEPETNPNLKQKYAQVTLK